MKSTVAMTQGHFSAIATAALPPPLRKEVLSLTPCYGPVHVSADGACSSLAHPWDLSFLFPLGSADVDLARAKRADVLLLL